ncbi:STY4851/ECs_5259 family protein [Bosea sp. NPDC055353]
MVEPQLTLNGARQALLFSRHMAVPDGSPLYNYRFEASEFDGVRELLRRGGANALRDPAGGALLVMYLAEWFRRERHGGGWDWVTPLGLIGIRYHPTAAGADVRYPEVRDCVETGLRLWRRPVPARGSLLTTVVQESGFPAADVAKGRLGLWLRRAVLTAERGLDAYEAVAGEAWRAPETLAKVLLPSVVKLCEAIVRLRAKVAGAPGDALAALDRCEPSWRASLPFDVRDDDFRHLVEELVVARQGEDPALRVERRYVLLEGVWIGQAEMKLNGALDDTRAPPDLMAGLAGYTRARLYPRGEAARWTTPIAALEREPDDCGGERWCLRPLVARYQPSLDHHQEVRLAVEAGAHQTADFVPLGGESLVGPVIALRLGDTDDPRQARVLEVLGTSPVSTTRPWLVLALGDKAAAEASVQGDHYYLPQTTRDGRRLLAFSGSVRISIESEVFVWRTNASAELTDRLVLVGPRVPDVRESVFSGPPTVWLESDGCMSSVRPSHVQWKPVGRGEWRTVSTATPHGSIYIAVRRAGQATVMCRTTVAPRSLRLLTNRAERRLLIDGLAGAEVRAKVDRSALTLTATHSGFTAPLGRLPPGTTLHLALTWESVLELSLDDPLAEPMLLAENGTQAPPHVSLTLSRLKGYRLLSLGANELTFEGRSAGSQPIQIHRITSGSMPLAAFEQVIEELLGAFDDLDATVRLNWANRGDWFAEVRRWGTRQPLQPTRTGSVFAALATRYTGRRRAISLQAPSAGLLADLVENDPVMLSDVLRRELAPGPWLCTGTASDGSVMRPVVVPDIPGSSTLPDPTSAVRELAGAVDDTLSDGSGSAVAVSREELRWLIDLCTAAKSIEAPYVAVDALRVLSKSYRLAPAVLAACRTPDERYAVLEVQGSLPFMWCMTEIRGWQSAFSAANAALRGQFQAAGFDDYASVAAGAVLRGLGQIVDALPVLSTHARLCIHGLGNVSSIDIPNVLTRRLQHDDLATVAQRLVARRPDDRIIALPRLSDLAGNQADLCRKFGDGQRFAEVLAAPVVAARSAAGRIVADSQTVAACRAAWTWDREYFEDAFRAALLTEAQTPVLEKTR